MTYTTLVKPRPISSKANRSLLGPKKFGNWAFFPFHITEPTLQASREQICNIKCFIEFMGIKINVKICILLD